jgi:hypothetical protein
MKCVRGESTGMEHTLLALPHVPQYLDMTRDLFLGSFYSSFFQVVDEELVAPSAAAPRVRGPRRFPVLPEP